ncbi:PID-CTERM protein-sorting domain-containing protein [Hymenobacter sp.]|jgi:hypothetical protein|uniref:PID-CTERM protein-sorting domain-containing protein n=1 Tax=Hymenobacter sp. TaxID=1898978 RepID=UPI002ED8640C
MLPHSTFISHRLYTWLKPVLLLLVLLLIAGSLRAQGPGSGGPTPTAVPIDGGASLLLAAGAAYGLRRLRKLRR